MARPEWIEVGRVSRPHGVNGEVRIRPDSDNPDRFVPGSVLHARPARAGLAGSQAQQQLWLTIEVVRGVGDFPIVAFREVGDREAAQAIRGYLLEIRSADLPVLDDDEYYPFDLEGLEVRDSKGTVIGQVNDVIESPAHAILAVSLLSGGESLVPFVAAAVPVVDVAQGYLVVESAFADTESQGTERS
jgi:16S rRNA processing protein RimM